MLSLLIAPGGIEPIAKGFADQALWTLCLSFVVYYFTCLFPFLTKEARLACKVDELDSEIVIALVIATLAVPMVDAGSAVLVLPSNSELIVFKPDDKQFQQLAQIKVSETSTYAHPVLAGNRVFVKDQDALTMWAID